MTTHVPTSPASTHPRRVSHTSWWARFGRTRLLLALVAFLAYAPGFWWGAPHATAADRTNAWGVDDEPPLGPLAQADDILHPKATQNPNLGYPMLHPFMVLGAFTPYMGYLFATGQLESPSAAYPHGFADPASALATLTGIAHFLSVLLGVGIVLCAYETGRVLWDERSGIASAVAAMLMYPMFYYARNSNVDVPVLFFTAAGLAAFAHIVRYGLTMGRSVIFGLLVGMAVATKEPAFASFVFAPFVMLALPDPGRSERPWRSRTFWRMALAGGATALLAYALFGGMIVDFSRWRAHIEFIQSRLQDLEANAVVFVTMYPRTLAGHADFIARLTRYLADCLSWPGLVLAVVSMAMIARRRQRDAILMLSAVGYLAVLFFSARAAQLRYLMPAAYVLALYAGRGVMEAWQSRRARGAPVLGLAALAALVLVSWAVDLTYVMLRDSRYAAAEWLARTARPGDALEYFGSEHKHPPMPAWLSSRQAIPFRGSMYRADTTDVAVQAITTAWRERQPRFVVIVPDYTNPGKPYTASCPPAIFRALEDGSLGYERHPVFETPALVTWWPRPALDHPVVNPPIRIYERRGESAAGP